MLSADGMRRVLYSNATKIGPNKDVGPSSVDSSLHRLMSSANGERHVSLSQAKKILVSTMPHRQSPDVSIGQLLKLSQPLALITMFSDYSHILAKRFSTARGIRIPVPLFLDFLSSGSVLF